MHNEFICHRDIKTCNLVIEELEDKNIILKLIDFGVSKRVKGNNFELFTPTGTFRYKAPEMEENNGYSLNIDIWAAGVVLG